MTIKRKDGELRIEKVIGENASMENWTMEELLCMETPYLTIDDMTEQDWIDLDFKLEKYDIDKKDYNLSENKVLAFVLQQIHYNKINLNKVPNFIRNGRQFQELVAKYNPELISVLFPTRVNKDLWR